MENDLSLRQLCPGQRAEVQALHNEAHMSRRLRDMGLVEGTAVECLGRSPGGDPAAYCVRGAVLAIRRDDGARVKIRII